MRLEDVVNFLIAWRNLGRLLHRHSSKHRRTSEHHLQETELMILSSEAVDFHFFKRRRADSLVSPAGLAITALHGGGHPPPPAQSPPPRGGGGTSVKVKVLHPSTAS